MFATPSLTADTVYYSYRTGTTNIAVSQIFAGNMSSTTLGSISDAVSSASDLTSLSVDSSYAYLYYPHKTKSTKPADIEVFEIPLSGGTGTEKVAFAGSGTLGWQSTQVSIKKTSQLTGNKVWILTANSDSSNIYLIVAAEPPP